MNLEQMALDNGEAAFEEDERARIAALHKSAPEVIWLQIDPEADQFDGWDAQTWCSDKINETDVKYVRADTAPPICPTAEWQPIETAPKDGTHVLLYFPELKKRGNEEVVIGFWHQPGNPSHPGFWMGWGSGRKTATHWMPLPAAPEYKP